MSQESKNPGVRAGLAENRSVQRDAASCFETQSLPSAPSLLPLRLYLLSRKSLSSILAFLIIFWASRAFAGDAVAIGHNKDGIWTSITYYSSSTPKGGKDYKTEAEARDEAIRDLRRRGADPTARAEILASSDETGFVAVARGTIAGHGDVTLVCRGISQAEANARALAELTKAGATTKQKIVYRYFSYGSNPSRTDDD